MATKSGEISEEYQNYEDLTENEILRMAKDEIVPIQQNLLDKKITITDAKKELQKINDWIQLSNLEKKDKIKIGKTFEKLAKLEKDIDEITLKNEVDEIIKLLESLTRKDLASLKNSIGRQYDRIETRPEDVQEGIIASSTSLDSTINDAAEDTNPIAKTVGKRMQYLMS